MAVRAKFVCNDKTGDSVSFCPVYSGSPENQSFFKATPSGSIKMQILNEAALAAFEVGKDYYVDFTPANG